MSSDAPMCAWVDGGINISKLHRWRDELMRRWMNGWLNEWMNE